MIQAGVGFLQNPSLETSSQNRDAGKLSCWQIEALVLVNEALVLADDRVEACIS